MKHPQHSKAKSTPFQSLRFQSSILDGQKTLSFGKRLGSGGSAVVMECHSGPQPDGSSLWKPSQGVCETVCVFFVGRENMDFRGLEMFIVIFDLGLCCMIMRSVLLLY